MVRAMKMRLRIGLVGDFDPTVTAHQGLGPALALASGAENLPMEVEWLPTPSLAEGPDNVLRSRDGIWCVPKSPYDSTHGALEAIQFARRNGIPFLGTCGGMQHAIMEFTESVLGTHAEHQELCPEAKDPVIHLLACSLVEQTGVVHFAPGSRLQEIYGSRQAQEGYHCRFGLNPVYTDQLEAAGLQITGRDEAGEARAVELAGHPFFIGTLFQPERSGLTGVAHPLIRAFLRAATESPSRS